jgi:hypothetical protein
MLDAVSYPKIQSFKNNKLKSIKKIRKTVICATDFKKVL